MSERIVATDGHEGHWFTGEEIVRCRDCVYYEQDGIADSCTLFDFSMDCQYMQNGFCAWGERRDA